MKKSRKYVVSLESTPMSSFPFRVACTCGRYGWVTSLDRAREAVREHRARHATRVVVSDA